MSKGQLYSLPVLIAGAYLIFRAWKRGPQKLQAIATARKFGDLTVTLQFPGVAGAAPVVRTYSVNSNLPIDTSQVSLAQTLAATNIGGMAIVPGQPVQVIH